MAGRTHKQTPFREISTSPDDPSSSWEQFTTADGFARLQKNLIEYQHERIEDWVGRIVSSDSKYYTALGIFWFWRDHYMELFSFYQEQQISLSSRLKRNLLEVFYLREISRSLMFKCLRAEFDEEQNITGQSLRNFIRKLMRGFYPYYGAITAYENGDGTPGEYGSTE